MDDVKEAQETGTVTGVGEREVSLQVHSVPLPLLLCLTTWQPLTEGS